MSTKAQAENKSALNHAVTLYHQASYDSSLLQLQDLLFKDNWKRRDSLSLFQYLGMASCKIGNDSASLNYFSNLLQVDSLFQFAKNEDPAILKIFDQAQESKRSRAQILNADLDHSDPNLTASGESLASSQPGPSISPAKNGPEEKVALGTSLMAIQPLKPDPKNPAIGFAYGAWPFGAGWMIRNRKKTGILLGALQAGGILVSIYASEAQSREHGDAWGTQNSREKGLEQNYQWIQRISLSTALGAYLFSLIASKGD